MSRTSLPACVVKILVFSAVSVSERPQDAHSRNKYSNFAETNFDISKNDDEIIFDQNQNRENDIMILEQWRPECDPCDAGCGKSDSCCPDFRGMPSTGPSIF